MEFFLVGDDLLIVSVITFAVVAGKLSGNESRLMFALIVAMLMGPTNAPGVVAAVTVLHVMLRIVDLVRRMA